MSVELLTEHHLEFLSLKGGYTGSSESKLVKIPHCWKSHVAAQMVSGTTSLALPEGRKSYAHQRETTGSSSDSLQIASLFKFGTSLKRKNLLPEGPNSFLLEQFLILWKITLSPLNVTIFIRHICNCIMRAKPMYYLCTCTQFWF